jgi:hypothetical protein
MGLKQGREPMSNDDDLARKSDPPSVKSVSPAAQRALNEAETRRKAAETAPKRPTEINGRKGPDPARYGDWEKKGIASDF